LLFPKLELYYYQCDDYGVVKEASREPVIPANFQKEGSMPRNEEVSLKKMPVILSDKSKVFDVGIYGTLPAKTEQDADTLIAEIEKLIQKHCV
jgi:hypothetical protein